MEKEKENLDIKKFKGKHFVCIYIEDHNVIEYVSKQLKKIHGRFFRLRCHRFTNYHSKIYIELTSVIFIEDIKKDISLIVQNLEYGV